MKKPENEIRINKSIEIIRDLIGKGCSNYRIAKETGISDRTIGNYVNGKTRPTPANAKIILNQYDDREDNNLSLLIENENLMSKVLELQRVVSGLERMQLTRLENHQDLDKIATRAAKKIKEQYLEIESLEKENKELLLENRQLRIELDKYRVNGIAAGV